MLRVIEFFSSDNKEHWLRQMEACDWGAGQWLAELLRKGTLAEVTGVGTLIPMAVDGDALASFCTFAPLDEIQPTDLTPWAGFVYTFPAYRGRRSAGLVLDWCESVAAVMGREAIYISTDHTGLYEKYGYSYLRTEQNISGEDCRIYRKLLQEDGPEKEARLQRGGQRKAEVVAAARRGTDTTAVCGFSCEHCFLGQWCGGCRSWFNCCSYGTLCDKGLCPNIRCCREKGIDGCDACDSLLTCQKGFYGNGNDGNAAKAQALFRRRHGKEAFLRVMDRLHEKYDFTKTQEVLGYDVDEALRILESCL